MSKTFEVLVTRTAYQKLTLAIPADNAEEASRKALDVSGDVEFPAAFDADYEVEGCIERKRNEE